MIAKIKGLSDKKISFSGSLQIPASKSHTIRALMIASLAKGKSRLINPLDSADTRSCIDACKAFGAEIFQSKGEWIVKGIGGKFSFNTKKIDVGNSGTTLYFAAGLAALSDQKITFSGDKQIQSRPVLSLLNSLKDFGAKIEIGNNGCAPFSVKGPLKGGETSIECPTSQYLSSLLIATPLACSKSIINVPLLMEKPYVEMTLKWLNEQGIKYTNKEYNRFIIQENQHYSPFKKIIPRDFSSSAFPLCAAAILGLKLSIEGLDTNDSQGDKAIIDYLKTMGCSFDNQDGKLTIMGPGNIDCPNKALKAADFDLNKTPDALPAMAVTACFAKGKTRLFNVPQARLKETDRISVMCKELGKMGAQVEETFDGLIIKGGKNLKGCSLNGHKDHRIVMALSIAALRADGTSIISDAESVDITYPDFFKTIKTLIYNKPSTIQLF